MSPRITRIIWTDWPALFCAISIPIIWIICGAVPVIRGVPAKVDLASAISVAAACALGWRIGRIRRLFKHGQPARARVVSVTIIRDRGRLEFEYEFGGTTFRTWMPVHKNKDVLAMYPGQEVEVLVDAKAPATAVVRHLYE